MTVVHDLHQVMALGDGEGVQALIVDDQTPVEGAIVKLCQQPGDSLVQLGQGEAAVMAQPSQNPALHHQHGHLGLGFLISHQMLVVRMTVQPESLRLPTRSTQSGGSNLP